MEIFDGNIRNIRWNEKYLADCYLDGAVLVDEGERGALAADVDVGAGGLGLGHLQGGGLGGGHQHQGDEQLAVHVDRLV